MCELNLVKVQLQFGVTVKLLTILSNNSEFIEYKKKDKIKIIPKQFFKK